MNADLEPVLPSVAATAATTSTLLPLPEVVPVTDVAVPREATEIEHATGDAPLETEDRVELVEPKTEHQLVEADFKVIKTLILDMADNEEAKQWCQSNMSKESSTWLSSLSRHWTRGFFVSSTHVQIAVSMKLLLPKRICSPLSSWTCSCGHVVDSDLGCMFHSVRCVEQGAQIRRHNGVANLIAGAIQSKHPRSCVLEPRIMEERALRNDLLVTVGGVRREFDIVVCHPFSGTSLGHAAGLAELRKIREFDAKIAGDPTVNRDLFYPLAMESTGTLGPGTRDNAWKIIKDYLNSKNREVDPEFDEIRTRILSSRIGSLLWADLASRYLRFLRIASPRREIR
jgi:hypothetical protein